MSNKRLNRLKTQAIGLARRPALNFFEFAGLITTLHGTDPISIRNLPDETGMSRRRLYYLVEVGRLIAEHKISKSDAEAIGWTKLQIIARHVKKTGAASAEVIETYFDMARTTKAHALAEVLRDENPEPTRAVMFHLSSEARSDLNYALVAFGAKITRRGLREKEGALLQMVRAAMIQRA